jgi:hypothetical protein
LDEKDAKNKAMLHLGVEWGNLADGRRRNVPGTEDKDGDRRLPKNMRIRRQLPYWGCRSCKEETLTIGCETSNRHWQAL